MNLRASKVPEEHTFIATTLDYNLQPPMVSLAHTEKQLLSYELAGRFLNLITTMGFDLL